MARQPPADGQVPERWTPIKADREPTLERRQTTRIERWLFAGPLWQFGAALFVLAALMFGVDSINELDYVTAVTRDPFQPAAATHYMYSSPLGFITAWVFHAHSPAAFTAMHFVWLIASLAAMVWTVARYVSAMAARLVMVAWFASPLANIQLTWLGLPDPGTMAAATVITVGPPWLCLLGGMLLGFNHFEQGVFIIAAAVTLRLVVRREPADTMVATLAGLTAGRMLLAFYQYRAGVTSNARARFIEEHGVGGLLDHAWGHAHMALWSVFAVLWLPMVAMWWRSSGRDKLALGGLFIALMLPVALTLDTTRVSALLTWPMAVVAALWWSNDPVIVRRWMLPLLAAAAAIPRVVVWAG